MASILPGYEYDIFISYRHKDNKYDGWITEFVQNLRKELEATFKEDVSIYFDFNPEDGLLESHSVDKSLEGKLKALIFIPILSQTYCDPKSFAWQHEFCAFNSLAKADAFGRDIKLKNGNVASRILPVRVRDLENEDKKLLEDELGATLRPIDFIYREQGVNRPLKPEDPEEKNLNKTKYRNQINKTANAIKEIITGLKNFDGSAVEKKDAYRPAAENLAQKSNLAKKVIIALAVAGLSVGGWFLFKHFNGSNGGNVGDKSIAVLPFEDLSAGHDQEYFSDGIAEEILNSLAHIPELKVAGRTSSFQFKGQKTDLREVGKKLNVKTVLEGSVRKMGNRVRITAQLIGVEDGYHIWSETYDRDLTDIFAIQDEVAQRITSVLLREMTSKTAPAKTERPENVKAFEYYLEGKHINLHEFLLNGKLEDFKRAEDLLLKALALDSSYALAHAALADLYNTYTNRVQNDPEYMRLQIKEIEIAYRLNPNLDYVNNALGQVQLGKKEYENAFRSFTKAVEQNPNDANNLHALASTLMRVGLMDDAIKLADRAVRIDPLEPNNFVLRGTIKFQIGQYEDASKDLLETLKQQPDNYAAVLQMAFYYLIKNNLPEARKYIDRANKILPAYSERSGAEAMYQARLGNKEKALSMGHDFRLYIMLGMKKEGAEDLVKFFSVAKPPVNFYVTLTRSALMDRVGDEPVYKAFLAEQKKQYEINLQKFKLPDSLK